MFPIQLPSEAVHFKRFLEQKRPGQLALRINKNELDILMEMVYCSFISKGHRNQKPHQKESKNQNNLNDRLDFSQQKNMVKIMTKQQKQHIIDMNYLKTIILYGLNLTSLTFLHPLSLTNLTHLQLHLNFLTSIQDLLPVQLPSLKFLFLQMNSLTSLQHFDKNDWKQLKYLSVYKNKITDVSDVVLWKFKQIKELILGHNRIEELFSYSKCNVRKQLRNSIIDSLRSLTSLNLQQNQICSIEPLQFFDLSCLQDLNLRSNHITSITSLKKIILPHIKTIDLSVNMIKDVEFLRFQKKTNEIKSFQLSFNIFSQFLPHVTKYFSSFLTKNIQPDKQSHQKRKTSEIPVINVQSMEIIEEQFQLMKQVVFQNMNFEMWEFLCDQNNW